MMIEVLMFITSIMGNTVMYQIRCFDEITI